MKTRYPKLLSPLQVGNVTLKNRIITGPMSIVELDPKGAIPSRASPFMRDWPPAAQPSSPWGEHCGQQQRDDPPPADPV